MTTWRMAMRAGNQGPSMWPRCRQLSVAAITYGSLRDVDLSRHGQFEPAAKWAELEPSQHASLAKVAYKMQTGDVIYVKEGPKIVGRGVVQGPYEYDRRARIVSPHGNPWRHQVPVKWEKHFTPVNILLGAEPTTVLELSGKRLQRLLRATAKTKERKRGDTARTGTRSSQFWLWVTRPDYYLEADGTETPLLQPSTLAKPGCWWTCHKGTRQGDLALLYRTAPKRDIAYLIEAATDAYRLPSSEVGKHTWRFGCDFRVLTKFANPLALSELRSDPVLRNWGPLRRNFQGIVFPVKRVYWQRLLALLARRNPRSFQDSSTAFHKFVGYAARGLPV